MRAITYLGYINTKSKGYYIVFIEDETKIVTDIVPESQEPPPNSKCIGKVKYILGTLMKESLYISEYPSLSPPEDILELDVSSFKISFIKEQSEIHSDLSSKFKFLLKRIPGQDISYYGSFSAHQKEQKYFINERKIVFCYLSSTDKVIAIGNESCGEIYPLTEDDISFLTHGESNKTIYSRLDSPLEEYEIIYDYPVRDSSYDCLSFGEVSQIIWEMEFLSQGDSLRD